MLVRFSGLVYRFGGEQYLALPPAEDPLVPLLTLAEDTTEEGEVSASAGEAARDILADEAGTDDAALVVLHPAGHVLLVPVGLPLQVLHGLERG